MSRLVLCIALLSAFACSSDDGIAEDDAADAVDAVDARDAQSETRSVDARDVQENDAVSELDGAAPDASVPFGSLPYETAGAFRPAVTRFAITRDDGVEVPVEVWYPTEDAAGPGAAASTYLTTEARRARYDELVDEAPAGCPRAETDALRGARPSGAPWPLVLYSHCHSCTRYSAFSIAERLASHGFAVAAPEHVGGALFDELDGSPAELSDAFLATRVRDIRRVADVLLDAEAPTVPSEIRGAFDAERVGMMGHSFGAVTSGVVLAQDPRFSAGMLIAAPVESPLFAGAEVASIERPMLFVVAQEDNSITELGNAFIRQNFDEANPPVWKVEVRDAGHWSFSDLCGLVDGFMACCGTGIRQTNAERFTYLDADLGRAIGASLATAWFDATLRAEEGGLSYLERGRPTEWIDSAARR